MINYQEKAEQDALAREIYVLMEGRKQGVEEGIKQGIELQKAMIRNMLTKGMDTSDICELTGVEEAFVLDVYSNLK